MTRRLSEQVVVITGASSGTGRETVVQFGRQGASVVLAAHNETALQETAREVVSWTRLSTRSTSY